MNSDDEIILSHMFDRIMERFDKLESRMDANDRRRLGKLRPPSHPKPPGRSHQGYSYQHPTRLCSCHEQPPGWPPPPLPPQRSPPADWPTQRRLHAYEKLPPQGPPYFGRDSQAQQQRSDPYRNQRTTHSNGQPWQKDRPFLQRSPSCNRPPTYLCQAEACLEQPTAVQQPLLQRPPSCRHPPSIHSVTKLVSCEEKHLGVEGDSVVLNQVDLRLNGMKLVDEESCFETEWIPSSHSSSLDHESDAHQKIKKNYSLNWRGSFLDEVDESKSSQLDDNHDTTTFDDDEFAEMEPQSVKLSDDSYLHLDVERESDSSSSTSCVDKSSQQKCWDSDDEDEDEDDRVDVLSQHQNLVQQMKMELKSCRIRGLPTISEDSETPKMIDDLRHFEIDHKIRYTDEILWWFHAKARELLGHDCEGRRSYNLTAAELQQLKVLAQRFMEDEQFGGRRNDDYVRSRCMIRSLLQVPTIKDDCAKTKVREERDDVITLEMLAGVIRETMVILFVIAFDPGGEVSMLLLSSTLHVVSWFPP